MTIKELIEKLQEIPDDSCQVVTSLGDEVYTTDVSVVMRKPFLAILS